MATYYIDSINGNDRNSTSNAVASNPSGSTVLITFPSNLAHQYVTGIQVTLTNFSAWLNATWTITVVNDYSFTLDGAVWQATADATGVCSPAVDHRGGTSWATAWRTLGKTIVGLPGDIFKVAKSPDPTYLGECDWSSETQVIIPSGLVKMIDDCEIAWTASQNVTSSTTTGHKFGTKKISLNIAAAFTTGKVAYRTLPSTLDLSDYQRVTFWATFNATIQPNTIRICLCSDTIGDVVVDSFTVNELQMSNNNRYVTLTKNGGGNLGSAIQSIAVYTDVDITTIITLDHILACKVNNIHLGSLISVNPNAQGGTEPWHCIRAIDDSILYFDYANTLWGAKHDSVSALPQATYIRETIKSTQVSSTSTTEHALGFNGSSSATTGILLGEIQGGFDTQTDACNGETLYDGQNYSGNNLNTGPGRRLLRVSHIGCFRYAAGYSISSSMHLKISDVFASANGNIAISCSGSHDIVFDNIISGGQNTGMLSLSNCLRIQGFKLRESYAGSNNHITIATSFNVRLQFKCYAMSIASRCLQVGVCCDNIILYDSVYYRLSDVLSFPASNLTKVQVYNLTILQDNSVVNSVYYGIATEITKSSVEELYDIWYNKVANDTLLYVYKIAPIAFNANTLVTITLAVKSYQSLGHTGFIKIARHDSFGITQEIRSALPANNNEFEDVTIQFTPTVAGVVVLEIDAISSFYFQNLRVVQ